jgi:hypothetical protein
MNNDPLSSSEVVHIYSFDAVASHCEEPFKKDRRFSASCQVCNRCVFRNAGSSEGT